MAAAAGPDKDLTDALGAFLEDTDPAFAPDAPERVPDRQPAASDKPAVGSPSAPAADDVLALALQDAEPALPARREPAPAPAARADAQEDEPKPDAPQQPQNFETTGDIAKAFGVTEPELLREIVVAPGQDQAPVSLQALIDRYNEPQGLSHNHPDLQAAIDRVESQAKISGEATEAAISSLSAHAMALLKLIEGDESKIQELRNTDPTAAFEMLDQIQQRRKALDDAFQTMQRLQAEARDRDQAEHQGWLQREALAVVQAIPSWKNPDRARNDNSEIQKYLVSLGFKPEEASGIVDHRYLVAGREGMLYRKLMARIAEAKGKRVGIQVPGVTLQRTARDDGGRFRSEQKSVDDDWTYLERTGDERGAARLMERLEDLD